MAAADLELYYFALYAKGLGPALVAEFSGLPWKGPGVLRNEWVGDDGVKWGGADGLKASGESPFGQMPLLKTNGPAGNIGQTVAIIQYLARQAGAVLEGVDEREFAVSQMLIAEAEDVYAALQRNNPTKFAALSTPEQMAAGARKGDRAMYDKFWAEGFPAKLAKLEALATAPGGFTSTGVTAGELLLFAYFYQMSLMRPADWLSAAPKVSAWFAALLRNEKVQKVVTGASAFGAMGQYFINPPAADAE